MSFRVGACMPTYNQAGFIRAALASWDAQVGAPERTLIVVDDGCTDGTRDKVLGRYGLRHEENQGTAAAINTGIRWLMDPPAAFTSPRTPTPLPDALTWISSDNEMSPGWLAVLSAEMERSGAGMVYGGFHYVRDNSERKIATYHFTPYDPKRLISDLNCFVGPAFLVRADVWKAAGEHRGKISHDYDHNLRVEEVCWAKGLPIVGVDKSLCRYNAHDKRVTVTRAHEYDAKFWQAEALARRKAMGL